MKISVITINLNNIQGLQATIRSVKSQSFHDYEWIVIDGGSSDGSKQLIEDNRDYFAYCVSEPDNGIYNAMNKGIAQAKGEYVLFLNSGDELASDNVLTEVSAYLTTDIIVGNVVLNKIVVGRRNKEFSIADLYDYSFPHQSSFIRRDLFARFGLYDEQWRIVADWAFFIDAIVFGHAQVSFMPIVVSRIQDGGISKDVTKRCAEAEQLRLQKFGPLWQSDMRNALSLKAVLSRPLTRRLYSLIYRLRLLLG